MLYNMTGYESTAGRMEYTSPAVIFWLGANRCGAAGTKEKRNDDVKMTPTWNINLISIIVVTLAYVVWNYTKIRKMSEVTSDIVEMAAIIRSGSNAFMKAEYKAIAIVVVLVS